MPSDALLSYPVTLRGVASRNAHRQVMFGLYPATATRFYCHTSNVDGLEGSDMERLMTPGELSDYLGIPVASLRKWRVRGDGPTGIRVGKHLRYRRADVDAWLDAKAAS